MDTDIKTEIEQVKTEYHNRVEVLSNLFNSLFDALNESKISDEFKLNLITSLKDQLADLDNYISSFNIGINTIRRIGGFI